MTANLNSIDKSMIFYDGSCAFCNTWVNIIRRIDRRKRININTLHSTESVSLHKLYRLIPSADTVLLLHHEKVYEKSEAVLKVISLLGFPFIMLSIFKVVPRRYRDMFYDFIARNRYRFARDSHSCAIDTQVKDK